MENINNPAFGLLVYERVLNCFVFFWGDFNKSKGFSFYRNGVDFISCICMDHMKFNNLYGSIVWHNTHHGVPNHHQQQQTTKQPTPNSHSVQHKFYPNTTVIVSSSYTHSYNVLSLIIFCCFL